MFWKILKVVFIILAILIVLPWAILLVATPFNARTPSEQDLSKSALLAKPPAPIAKELTLKVITFNLWDLYLISTHRAERMRGIGQALRELDPDIVGFQEAWIEKDRQTILDTCADTRLKYHQYYPSGTVGSGKFVVSAFPIQEAFFHRYLKNGKWYKPYHGDWWGGKGVALARLQLPDNLGYVDFYDTHAHASYGSPEYDADREAQMQEMADFIKASATGTSPVIVVGDFNCATGSKVLHILVDQANLQWMMTGDPRIDNIFAGKNPRYAFELMDFLTIDRKVPTSYGETHLSDHRGYMSTIHITPTGVN